MLRKNVNLWMLLLVSCAQGPDIWVPREVDFTPPRLVSCERDSSQSVVLSFDKPVEQLVVEPPKGEVSFTTTDQRAFLLNLSVQPEPGAEWVLRVQAADPLGNSAVFLVAIYGVNPRLPQVRLNELNIQGSTTKPDYIELLVQSDGNLAGLVVALGAPAQGEAFYTFPSVEVKTGDYLILHTKPQGIAQEKDESKHKRESGGLLSSSSAWDFWWRGGKGLSGTTGLVVLLDNPRGKTLDAVIYTNRTSASDERYGGWGSKTMVDKVKWLHGQGVWASAGEEALVPEDAVFSGSATSTRTLNRKNTGEGKGAWFTGASGTASPGWVNTTQVHVP